MKLSSRLAARILGTLMISTLSTQAQAAGYSPRWVIVDALQVRDTPQADREASGLLVRGAPVMLEDGTQRDGYCHIRTAQRYGYVACQHLSSDAISISRAGVAGIDVAQRWIAGNAIPLRATNSANAPVSKRLPLNTVVTLLREFAGQDTDKDARQPHCEVQLADGSKAYVACAYLASTPFDGLNEDPAANGYDPLAAFQQQASPSALLEYAAYLKRSPLEKPPATPWPRNLALEKMKTQLAVARMGNKPVAYTDWIEWKRKARKELKLRAKLNKHASASQEQGQHSFASPQNRAEQELQWALAVDFHAAKPSLFRSEKDLAPASSTPEEASGRFGIPFSHTFSPRTYDATDNNPSQSIGVYDIRAHQQQLSKPVQQVRLYRDGRLRTSPSLIPISEDQYYDVDSGCGDFVEGYSYGDADKHIWRFYRDDNSIHIVRENSRKQNPAGSLYLFYTKMNLTGKQASVTETRIRMNRDTTGFIAGTSLYYDLDGDGIPDIVAWEGIGKGPGDITGMSTTDDRWYRRFMVNINGRWKMLGSDTFQYGCGC